MKLGQSVVISRLLMIALALLLLHGSALHAQPAPFTPDPDILAVVEQVNEDSLRASIDQLVGFHTRHTYSDTTSPTTGVGAARSWVLGEYQRHGFDANLFHWLGSWGGQPHPAANVVGSLAGTSNDIRLIVLGGHLDSRTVDINDNTSFAPGADDDGSAVAAMIEIARLLGDNPLPLTVLPVAFTGEEQGLLGSGALAQQMQQDGEQLAAMLNMDMLAHAVFPSGLVDTNQVRLYSALNSRQLARYVKWVGDAYADGVTGMVIPAEDRPGRGGDHSSFSDRGFPAMRVIEMAEDTDYQHDTTDVPAHMDFSYFRKNVRRVLGVVMTIAQAPATPPAPGVVNQGDGEQIIVSWPSDLPIPEGGQLIVAVRSSEDDDWTDIVTLDGDTSALVNPGVEGGVFVSLSVVNAAGFPSPFSPETRVDLSAAVLPVEDLASTSRADGVQLTWTPRPEGNVTGYRIVRRLGSFPQAVIDTVDAEASVYLDTSCEEGGFYRYWLETGNDRGEWSDPTNEVYGALASHHLGILVLDDTPDGDGTLGRPTGEQVNSFYSDVLTGFDVEEVVDVLAGQINGHAGVSDADLAPYCTVLIHADNVSGPNQSFGAALHKYIEHGGHVMLSGNWWGHSVGGAFGYTSPTAEGSLMREMFGVDSVTVTAPPDHLQFAGMTGEGEYEDLAVNPDAFSPPSEVLPLVEALVLRSDPPCDVIGRFDSVLGDESPWQGLPVALIDTSDIARWALIDFPLSSTMEADADHVFSRAMIRLGNGRLAVPEDPQGMAQPGDFRIVDAWPNPFNPSVTIRYTVPSRTPLRLEVFDLLGRCVASLADGPQAPGTRTVQWDASGHASGVYLVRLDADGHIHTRKVMLLK